HFLIDIVYTNMPTDTSQSDPTGISFYSDIHRLPGLPLFYKIQIYSHMIPIYNLEVQNCCQMNILTSATSSKNQSLFHINLDQYISYY
ncbi:hypothetical protein ACJX0J_010289, partial [Zea mays]